MPRSMKVHIGEAGVLRLEAVFDHLAALSGFAALAAKPTRSAIVTEGLRALCEELSIPDPVESVQTEGDDALRPHLATEERRNPDG